jgi:two-component system NtrC family sensor kinase
VLTNIVINAIDATDAGGHITIKTRVSGRGVEVLVSDTGCGIPQKQLSRVFDPFFTTKRTGAGTGLGLSVSLGIVQAHGGTIGVTSKEGEGSTFTVWLPYKEERANP